MLFPFAFAWLNALHAVIHSHNRFPCLSSCRICHHHPLCVCLFSCTHGHGIFWSLHWEGWGEGHVERAENDLVDERSEINNRVVDFVAKLCWFAIIEPDLESCVNHKEEFGREFFVEVFFCFEDGLVAVYHVRENLEVGGPQEKMSFFQIAYVPILSIPFHLKLCQYDPCEVSLKKWPLPYLRTPQSQCFFGYLSGGLVM